MVQFYTFFVFGCDELILQTGFPKQITQWSDENRGKNVPVKLHNNKYKQV